MRLLLQRLVTTAVVLAAIAYYIYALVTETGLVGWINVAQQSLFGSYSLKFSAAVLVMLMVPAGGALWILADSAGWLKADPQADRALFGDVGQAAEPAAASPGGSGLLIVGVAMVVISWGVGLAYYGWQVWLQRGDAQATWESVDLSAPGGAPKPAGDRLLLKGRLLGDHILTHSKGTSSNKRDDYHLIPVVPAEWTPGQPVTYLLKVDRLSELDAHAATQRAARDAAGLPVLRVRLAGEPPVPAVQQLAKSNVPMASPRYLLRIAPATDSQAAEAELKDAWETVLISCGIITAIVVVAFPLLAWRMRGMARKAASA